ncbi:sulfate ABC transporter ATP-binding protein [Rhodospirillum rubrum]|uniref:sulfate/molybdate ABC transporter ATP-binding protein n=1 Tax=Rhodospirillum rubrum TaxID=1085 RepID=UPI0019035DBF|nr:sulfate/molybdate ABC transporter ATP-binding protein [Rhodospirillum rubrum]MBK1665396.1 sulfate ABC transporter ATP-binding protein [Rhodospirillum rubrum]MBK1677282.1 sulfate ABC transporter ATP-binding protein [Rhodospirillum rubrum]
MRIDIENIRKTFRHGTAAALAGVDLAVASGELVALLGPSGSGKTTLLRIIAGLEFPDGGRVLFDGEDASALPVRDRHVGFVFQQYALFRHMTVLENVAFGLRVRPRATRPSDGEINRRVRDLLTLVQLEGLEGRYPAQLSGGQRQRVALARALAIEPGVLLLDEPFGALDARVRKDLRRWLRELHDRTGHTTVFVTHDQEEALELADRVVVFSQGRIEQAGSPVEVYDRPATPFVYDFLGSVNRLPVEVRDGHVWLDGHAQPLANGQAVDSTGLFTLYARPHDLGIADQTLPAGTALPGIVAAVRQAGAVVRLDVRVAGLDHLVEVEVSAGDERWRAWKTGSPVALVPVRFDLFPR